MLKTGNCVLRFFSFSLRLLLMQNVESVGGKLSKVVCVIVKNLEHKLIRSVEQQYLILIINAFVCTFKIIDEGNTFSIFSL